MRRKLWMGLQFLLIFAAALLSGPGAWAGLYADGVGGPGIDAGIPGFVGPDGMG